MVTENNTLDYYNSNSEDFVRSTRDVDFMEVQDKFLGLVAPKGVIEGLVVTVA